MSEPTIDLERPVLVLVSQATRTLAVVTDELRKRYGDDYLVVVVDDPSHAVEELVDWPRTSSTSLWSSRATPPTTPTVWS